MTSDEERARREELLAAAALEPLSSEELAELSRAGAYDPSYERAAAALAVAYADREPMPPSLHEKIRLAALAEMSRAPVKAQAASSSVPPRRSATVPMPTILRAPAPAASRSASDRTRWIGWLAAAACLGGATAVWIYRKPPVATVITVPVPVTVRVVEAPPVVAEPTPSEARAALLASASDVVTTEWTATKDPAATGVTGDIVWSNADQKGFMRFHGALPNDKVVSVYQLWIFDKDQDARFPIDGGVFDLDENGDVVVPIHAKLHVDQPTLFAVTIEKPGGVVVSKRERIVVTATPKAG